MPPRKRLSWETYDYSSAGAYFVTLCCQDRKCLFAPAKQPGILSAFGKIVRKVWSEQPQHYPGLDLDLYAVMPNHFHALMFLQEMKGSAPSISGILRAFKAQTTREINELRGSPGGQVWQRGFNDRVVRNEKEFERIRKYIHDNPAPWALDEEHSGNS